MEKSVLRYQNTNNPPLLKFAHLGFSAGFTSKLEYLARLAERESWYYDSPNAKNERQKDIGVLYQYIHHTFARAEDEGKILISEEHALMNTGLFTPNGEEIFAFFSRNLKSGPEPNAQKWYLMTFCRESDRTIPEELRAKLPAYVDYFSDSPRDIYFDASKKIFVNVDHIIDENFDRLPDMVKSLPMDIIKTLFSSAENIMRRKITRNNRLVVPQYYKKQIAYLAPLQISTDIIPLAIEKQADTYRVNTILTHGMAYCNARLLMKPESNWLTNNPPVRPSKKKEPTPF